jgi:hypothetical protein
MELLSIVMEMPTATQRAEKKKSPGAGGQLAQGSRPAVALRFHAAVARAAAVRGLPCFLSTALSRDLEKAGALASNPTRASNPDKRDRHLSAAELLRKKRHRIRGIGPLLELARLAEQVVQSALGWRPMATTCQPTISRSALGARPSI